MPDEGECHLKTMAVILLTVILSLQRSLYPVSAQMPAEQLTAEESAAEENTNFSPVRTVGSLNGWRHWAYFVWKGRISAKAYGKYNKDHDLYSGSGKW